MNILHQRIANVRKADNGGYCISHVYIDGKYSHDTIEDYDRGLLQTMTKEQVARLKVYGKTAIPTGTYTLRMDVPSTTFGRKAYYHDLCVWTKPNGTKLHGCVPRFDPVVGFSGVLMHTGNTEDDSLGCVIVGRNTQVGRVTDSRATFSRIYPHLLSAALRGEPLTYTIERKYK